MSLALGWCIYLFVSVLILNVHGTAGRKQDLMPSITERIPERLNPAFYLNASLDDFKAKGITVSAECESSCGIPYVNRWKAEKKRICNSLLNTPTSSVLDCYSHPSNFQTMFCHGHNIIIDSTALLGGYDNGKTFFPKSEPKSVRVSCTLDKGFTVNYKDDFTLNNIFAVALQHSLPESEMSACKDPLRMVNHPVWFMSRWDPTNHWHHWEDLITMFLELLMLDLDVVREKGVEIVVMDAYPPGFYMEIWRRISWPFPVRFLKSNPYAPGTCFKHFLLRSRPWASLLTSNPIGRPSTCRSAVVDAVRRWLHAILWDTRPEAFASLATHKQNSGIETRKVTWITRRNFELSRSGQLNGWQAGRMFRNEDELLKGMMNRILEWNARACLRQAETGPPQAGAPACRNTTLFFDLQIIEPSDVRFHPDQLQIYARTNILIASHGAAVSNFLWLPTEPAGVAAVIEVMHNAYGNYHYHNGCHLLGIPYKMVNSGGNLVAVDAVLQELEAMMESMAAEHKAQQDKQAAQQQRQQQRLLRAAAAAEVGNLQTGQRR